MIYIFHLHSDSDEDVLDDGKDENPACQRLDLAPFGINELANQQSSVFALLKNKEEIKTVH